MIDCRLLCDSEEACELVVVPHLCRRAWWRSAGGGRGELASLPNINTDPAHPPVSLPSSHAATPSYSVRDGHAYQQAVIEYGQGQLNELSLDRGPIRWSQLVGRGRDRVFVKDGSLHEHSRSVDQHSRP